jgi:hypothetical protein
LVRGIDLSPMQPLWVPPNVSFLVDDCEQDWITRDVDLVHFRFMAVILKDVAKVLGHAYKYDLPAFSTLPPPRAAFPMRIPSYNSQTHPWLFPLAPSAQAAG